jgi:cytochrome c-type biogenesis protein CcsB
MTLSLFEISEAAFKIAVIFYLAATGLYLVYLAKRPEKIGKLATIMASVAVSAHTAGLLFRWAQSGINHPPFTNLYESLLFFSWGIAVFYLFLEYKYKFKAGGVFILPVTLGAMGAAVLNPESSKEIQNLMPALQSHWLHAHVAIAAIAYAAFVASFGTSVMFLLRDNVERKWMGFGANIFMAFMLLIADRLNILFHGVFNLNSVTADGQVTGQLIPFSTPGKFFLMAVGYFVIAAALYLVLHKNEVLTGKRMKLLGIPFAPLVTLIGALSTFAGLGLLVWYSINQPNIALFGNPFKIIILCLVVFVGFITVFMDLLLEKVRIVLPESEKLDSMTYVIITIGFPLMTMVIVTGMVWAKYAFGEYWQWDPKETASLISWLIYTGYLHARIVQNWSPRSTAVISIIGFISVVFTYLGVNVIGPGYHAYASF